MKKKPIPFKKRRLEDLTDLEEAAFLLSPKGFMLPRAEYAERKFALIQRVKNRKGEK